MTNQEFFRVLFHGGNSYWLTRFAILRLLGFVYAVAFLVAANQILPLIGADGLLPRGALLDGVRVALVPCRAWVQSGRLRAPPLDFLVRAFRRRSSDGCMGRFRPVVHCPGRVC